MVTWVYLVQFSKYDHGTDDVDSHRISCPRRRSNKKPVMIVGYPGSESD